MKSFIFLTLILLSQQSYIYDNNLAQSHQLDVEVISCKYLIGFYYYDLWPLSNYSSIYSVTNNASNTYYFSFCETIQDTTKSCADKTTGTMGTMYSGGECQRYYSGSDPSSDSSTGVDDWILSVYYFNSQASCDSDDDYSLKFTIQCGSDDQYFENAYVDESDPCRPIIYFTSFVGCSTTSINAFWEWINSNKWVCFAVFLLLGLFICFAGRLLFKPVMFIAGVVATLCLAWIIFYNSFLDENTEQWVGWVVLACAVLVGLIIGCCMVKLVKLGAFVMAAWGGFSLALLLYNAFLYMAFNDSQVGFWIFCVGLALVCGILALFMFDHIMIHSTALAGAFLAVNGIGIVAGGYQNPFTLAYQLEQNVTVHIDSWFYLYLVGTFLLYAIGAFVQYKQLRKGDYKHPYHD